MFQTIRDPELVNAWSYLQYGPDMTAFQRLSWNQMLEEEFERNRLKKFAGHIQYFVVYRDDLPVVIAPLHIQTRSISIGDYGYKRGVYFIGMKGYSDYLNFIYRELDSSIWDELYESIVQETGIKRLLFCQIPEKSSSNLLLSKYEAISNEICVALTLPESFEEMQNGISKNLKSNLKKQRNRYAKDGFDMDVMLHEGSVGDYALVNRIKEIHLERYAKKNEGNVSQLASGLLGHFKNSFDEISYAMQNNPESWLLTGVYDNKIISYFYGLKDGGGVRIMQLGFDNRFARYMPGTIMFLKYIEQNYKSGQVYDFTRGEERYKYELGGEGHMIHDYLIEG